MTDFFLCQKCFNQDGGQCDCDTPLEFAVRTLPQRKIREIDTGKAFMRGTQEVEQNLSHLSFRERRIARTAQRCKISDSLITPTN